MKDNDISSWITWEGEEVEIKFPFHWEANSTFSSDPRSFPSLRTACHPSADPKICWRNLVGLNPPIWLRVSHSCRCKCIHLSIQLLRWRPQRAQKRRSVSDRTAYRVLRPRRLGFPLGKCPAKSEHIFTGATKLCSDSVSQHSNQSGAGNSPSLRNKNKCNILNNKMQA